MPLFPPSTKAREARLRRKGRQNVGHHQATEPALQRPCCRSSCGGLDATHCLATVPHWPSAARAERRIFLAVRPLPRGLFLHGFSSRCPQLPSGSMKGWLLVPWSCALPGWLGKRGRQAQLQAEMYVAWCSPNTGQRRRCRAPKRRKKTVCRTEFFKMVSRGSERMLSTGLFEA